jgi:putative transposase
MSWTPEQRRRYAPAINEAVRASATVRLAAAIDVIDPPARTGRPRLWSTLSMVQALWWLCRAGAAWALLPSSCPPRQTIGSRLERWVRLGVLDRALAVLNACLRLARGRSRRPSAGILDTQSVRTGPQAGPRGYDANKKVRGRKRVLLADTEGLVQALRIVPASIQDRDTPALIEPELAAGDLRKVWADLAFAGERAAAPLARHGIALELVGRRDKTGFAVEPRRWKIERTFGCLQRYRRLLVDHEGSTGMSRIMTLLAALFMTGARFERQITG